MASSQYTVYFNRGATSAVTVDRPDGVSDDDLVDALIDAASNDLQSGLCHHCARGITLGDPEPVVIDGRDGDVLYDEESERAARHVRNVQRAATLSAAIARALVDIDLVNRLLDGPALLRQVEADLRRALEG